MLKRVHRDRKNQIRIKLQQKSKNKKRKFSNTKLNSLHNLIFTYGSMTICQEFEVSQKLHNILFLIITYIDIYYYV